MQLVLSNNRVIAHGENFLAMGGTVINTDTGKKYENATVAECESCPSDIGEVGYEYEAGIFKPCAPYGKGNNEGYVMEVCTECATPRNSGIPIKELSRMHLLWENPAPSTAFAGQTIDIEGEYNFLLIEFSGMPAQIIPKGESVTVVTHGVPEKNGTYYVSYLKHRTITYNGENVIIAGGMRWNTHSSNEGNSSESNNLSCVPNKIYGMKFLGV